MTSSIIIVDESGVDLTDELRALLLQVAQKTLNGEGLPADVEVGLTFVDDEGIAILNEQYRGVSASTDVLSFPLFETEEIERLRRTPDAFPERPVLLGDVVISAPTAARQADEYGHELQRELAFLFVHGLLHLLGYDHDEPSARQTMRRAEEAVLNAVGLPR